MAKRSTKSASTSTPARGAGRSASGPRSSRASGGAAKGRSPKFQSYRAGDAKGKHLVIVESPSKAKTINKYLGPDYYVMASVGHVRDLPSKAPKGSKQPVPGVNLEKRFTPTYEVLSGKEKVISDLKRAAKEASDVWFATDLDREGEAIAWHLAEELGIPAKAAKRVVFASITKQAIEQAFNQPRPIDIDKVNAQQARRILDRIVGYQVSPLLWKKVARGLSAGRVQSVAVRLVVEREREIRAFVPDEHWSIEGLFALSAESAADLQPKWRGFLGNTDEKGNPPTQKSQTGWLSDHGAIRAELIEIDGKKFDIHQKGIDFKPPIDRHHPHPPQVEAHARETRPHRYDTAAGSDITPEVVRVAEGLGLGQVRVHKEEDPDGRGPARWRRSVSGVADPSVAYRIASIETKRTRSRPAPPLITSTMQQAASSRLGFAAQRTMRTAQALYEGVDIPGEGPVGLITYMRTDSTVISREALNACRGYIQKTYGEKYLPAEPNYYASSNKAAQEAHECIRPTSLDYPPQRVRSALTQDQFKLYSLIWERFVGCQMTAAEWDSTTVLIKGGRTIEGTFRATGRILAFDGHYRVTGVPKSDELTLPRLEENLPLYPFDLAVEQRFTQPPSRYSEASLIKVLESEGIGRPSTYASIIQVIQDRKYVEQVNRAFHATDLGEVVTDKLVEAFPKIMDLGYTRDMEADLDKIEEEAMDWVDMLARFYGPFRESLAAAEQTLSHAKAEVVPAPKEYRCEKCGSDLVYRFGKNGKFLSCSRYPDCNYASPIDRMGRPMKDEFVDVKCPKTGRPMVRKTGRFGPFITTVLEEGEPNEVGIILNIDRKGHVNAPSPPPLVTELPCPTCEAPLNLREGVRGPWLGCSRFPKCRGRGKWAELDEKVKSRLEDQLAAHAKANPIPTIVRYTTGEPLTDAHGKPVKNAPTVDQLALDHDPREREPGPDARARSREPAHAAA